MEDPDTLWCCHVEGPDDVFAAGSQEEAERWAHTINGMDLALDVMLKAKAAPWPWSAEAHAEDLLRSRAEFALALPAQAESLGE